MKGKEDWKEVIEWNGGRRSGRCKEFLTEEDLLIKRSIGDLKLSENRKSRKMNISHNYLSIHTLKDRKTAIIKAI